MIKLGRMGHGGIMVNYRCTAACRHCLYACSPERDGGYMTVDTAREVCGLMKKNGCTSVHIGGGEPFMDFDGLLEVIAAINSEGIALEYVETNAYWADGREKVMERLKRLNDAGGDTLCISVDPYHAEYIPVSRPLGLAEMCREAGMGYFLWQQQYVPGLSALDMSVKHSREEFEKALGRDYILDTALRYGLNFGGRALKIEREYGSKKSAEEWLSARPCRGLISTNHYHVDYKGNFIPPVCTGIRIPLRELTGGLPSGKYKIFEALYENGLEGLHYLAGGEGFRQRTDGYSSGCDLCFDMRRSLSERGKYPELDTEYYTAALAYYD